MVEIIISYYKSEKFLLEEVARGNHVTNSKSSEKSTKNNINLQLLCLKVGNNFSF